MKAVLPFVAFFVCVVGVGALCRWLGAGWILTAVLVLSIGIGLGGFAATFMYAAVSPEKTAPLEKRLDELEGAAKERIRKRHEGGDPPRHLAALLKESEDRIRSAPSRQRES